MPLLHNICRHFSFSALIINKTMIKSAKVPRISNHIRCCSIFPANVIIIYSLYIPSSASEFSFLKMLEPPRLEPCHNLTYTYKLAQLYTYKNVEYAGNQWQHSQPTYIIFLLSACVFTGKLHAIFSCHSLSGCRMTLQHIVVAIIVLLLRCIHMHSFERNFFILIYNQLAACVR